MTPTARRLAPGTLGWLAALRLTASALARTPDADRQARLEQSSTNLANLSTRPLRVLAASAVWTEAPTGPGPSALFAAVHVPAERWLGTARWFGTVAIGHVGATLLSQGKVARDIRKGLLDESASTVVDVGVSYGTAAVMGVLTYRVPASGKRRLAYVVGCVALYTVPVVRSRTFTDYGHLAAYVLGLACHRLVPPNE